LNGIFLIQQKTDEEEEKKLLPVEILNKKLV
jgi:hypothetical protein